VHEPSDAAMWRSVEATVRNVLLPAIDDDWARVIAIQLAGMARFAATRPTDPSQQRADELAAVLDGLAGNGIVAAHWPAGEGSAGEVLVAVSGVLADAVSHHDAEGDAVRAQLRTVVSRHLDEDLAVTGMLMPYFRGQLPDA
jgi:hypothetical protein